jgi:hypothetical protein
MTMINEEILQSLKKMLPQDDGRSDRIIIFTPLIYMRENNFLLYFGVQKHTEFIVVKKSI